MVETRHRSYTFAAPGSRKKHTTRKRGSTHKKKGSGKKGSGKKGSGKKGSGKKGSGKKQSHRKRSHREKAFKDQNRGIVRVKSSGLLTFQSASPGMRAPPLPL